MGGGHIDFGPDPVAVSLGVSITLSYLHNIMCTNGLILTRYSWIYNLDMTKNWLDIGDLDLIFNVTTVEKLKIHGEVRGWGGGGVLWGRVCTCFL